MFIRIIRPDPPPPPPAKIQIELDIYEVRELRDWWRTGHMLHPIPPAVRQLFQQLPFAIADSEEEDET